MYTNINIRRHRCGRRRKISRHDRQRKLKGSVEQRHLRILKLHSTGMDASQIGHQLHLKRKSVRKFIAIQQYASLPWNLTQALKEVKLQASTGPLLVVFDRSEWQPSESGLAAAGYCTSAMAA